MSYATGYQFGPSSTNPMIKRLILITVSLSLGSALLSPFFVRVLGWISPQELLSLSPSWLNDFFIWQPLSYMFVHPMSSGIDFFFLIGIFFNMYLLWIAGSALCQSVGNRAFLRFYLITGVVTGLCTAAGMSSLGIYGHLAGCNTVVMGLLLIWTMLYPQNIVQFLFTFTLPARWLILGFIAASILIDLSHFNLLGIITTCSGVGFSYLYAVMAWDLRSPFPITHSLDNALSQLGVSLRHLVVKPVQSPSSNSKIYDLSTGEPLVDKDEEFMDKMLNKISVHGEESLTWNERRKMRKISEKKQSSR